jgi:hypothetical protein
MQNLSGRFFLDGIDLYTVFGIFIEEGSADFLKYPPKKASIEHDWQDSNGREVDLSRVFFDQREGTLNMAILTNLESDFWQKHNDFISQFAQPGLHRLEFSSHGSKSYFVYYQETNNYKSVKPLRGSEETGLYAYRFSMVIIEPEPQIDASNIYLIDEEGHFLIT